MKKPVIGIISRNLKEQNYLCCIEKARQAIILSGGIPICIVPTQAEDQLKKDPLQMKEYSKEEQKDLVHILKLCDGFLLPGGDDWYELDELVVDYAIKKDIPLLGICLGMQVLGKKLSKEKRKIVDNTEKNNSKINHMEITKDKVHKVKIRKDSKLYKIVKKLEIDVNSRHNYHIPEIQEEYISARSEDGLIEGIEMKKKKFIIGVQWHPESIIEKDKYAKRIFTSFIKMSKK